MVEGAYDSFGIDERMSEKRDDVVVIGEASGGGRHAEEAVLWQLYVLDARANLVGRQIVVQAAVIVDRDDLLIVLDLEVHRKRLVAEVAQASA